MTFDLSAPTQLERISTGVPALDELLGGGVPKYSISFISGRPGTGKTVLCQQAMFANARKGNRVLYLGTRSEPVLKMMRFVQSFSFYDEGLVGGAVTYGDLSSALVDDSGIGLLEEIESLVKEHRPALLIIDEFRALRERFEEPSSLRDFTSKLMTMLAAWEVTAFFIGVYSEEEVSEFSEFAIADGIIYLYGTAEAIRQRRFLRVLKMRGTDFFAGQHSFEITRDGLEVFPRLDPAIIGEYQVPSSRFPSVVEGVTEMLAGGVEDSTSVLISGSTGSGKTLLALSLLVGAAQQRKPGLFVSFEESAAQIKRNAISFEWDLDTLTDSGFLDLFHVSPSELDVDRHGILIKKRADAIKAQCIVIDAVSVIAASVDDPQKYRNYMWAILDYFKRTGVAIVMTYESTSLPAPDVAMQGHVSFLADVIINLRLTESDGELKRTINVTKMRGNTHDRRIRELIIESGRLAVGAVFQG